MEEGVCEKAASAEMRHFQIELSDPKPPLTLNQRGHWAKTDGARKKLRHEAATRAKSLKIPSCTHITTRLHYVAPDRRRRDEDNLIASAKPLWDGLVDAGVVPDDTSEFMTKLMPKIHPPDGNGPRMWLEITIEEESK